MKQFFAENINNKIILKDDDLHHLVNVLRANDENILCVIEGITYLCNFKGDSDSYNIEILDKIERNSELNTNIELYQALIRNENFDLVIQKATELGVSQITPTIFKRNVVKIDKDREESKLIRFNKIVKGASEQSKRMIIPTVTKQIHLKDISLNDNELGIICYEKNDNTISLSNIESIIKNTDTIKVVIGPEGGFTIDEYEMLVNKGFKSVSLGKRILRSETAAISILSILSYILELK